MVFQYPYSRLYAQINGTNTHYISTAANGGSNSNNGSIESPWLTLAYACAHASTPGDTIYVNSGTYIETNECALSIGVSIKGAGKSNTIIKSHYATSRHSLHPFHASITLLSTTQGSNGNQSISDLTLDGDNLKGDENGNVSYIGILVYQRSNVIIHDCIIQSFFTGGILLHGCYAYSLPTTYASGNQIYNCSIINCVDKAETYGSAGLIELGGQTELLIHDNILNQTGRAKEHNGDIIVGVYNNKGVKIYNNKFYKPDDNGMAFNFHLEIWDVRGGWEVYNNEFYGGDTAIDIAGNFNYKGTYPYSWYIHHNYFTNNGGSINRTNQGKTCIIMEDDYIEDVIIEKNHFYKITRCIDVGNYGQSNQTVPIPYNRININYNKFELCGWNASNEWDCIMRFRIKSDSYIQDVNICNNVMLGDNVSQMTAIKILPAGTFTNFNIKNNIVRYCNGDVNNNQFVHYGWLGVGNNGTISGLHVDNNILFNNYANNNPALLGNIVIDYTFLNNYKKDPSFVSSTDFHLNENSIGINNGTDVGLSTDFAGAPVSNPPEIGVYEYVGQGTSSFFLKIWYGDILVYPNPVNNILNISVKNSVKEISLKLYDIKGNELYQTVKNGDCKLDVSMYQPGVYFLDIITEGKTDIMKIIKN